MQKLHLNDKHYCLVCGEEMTLHHKIEYADYACAKHDDHHFSYRVKEDRMIKLRIRFTEPDGSALRLKVHYDLNYSEVWSASKAPRIKIDQIIVPDFTKIDVLKNKIKTYLVFG